jgi:hypothetical protein
MHLKAIQDLSFIAWRRFILCSCAAAILAVPGAAATIQPLVYGNINGVNVSGIGNYTVGGSTVTMTTQPGVSLSAHTNASNGVSVVLDYYFDITGGQVGDNVPISVDGLVSVNAVGDDGSVSAAADATFSISLANGNHGASHSLYCGNVLRGASCGSDSWAGALQAIGWVGYTNTVQLQVDVSVNNGSGSADAYADPHVYIDPTFAASHPEYGLEFSPATGNSLAGTSAPEPSSWFLLVSGALAGAVLLRRRAV